MIVNLNRQLKDIQHQAEKLTSGSPEPEELEMFSDYSNEIKNYVLTKIDKKEITKLALEIPNILEVENETKSLSNIVLIIGAIFTIGLSALYISYITNLRRTKLIQNNIHTARGKFASIEFLLKAYQ